MELVTACAALKRTVAGLLIRELAMVVTWQEL